jgi:hypothetical protein
MVTENNIELRATVTRAAIPQTQQIWLEHYSSWKRFHAVRKARLALLQKLPDYRRCVLVAGCQRSGTTMLTHLIAGSPGFARLHLTVDDELDAALALAGYIDLPSRLRYCFQTTYLNEQFPAYRTLAPDQRLIWVVRNPYSVVYSMLHNWRRFALNELYASCGLPAQASPRLRRAWLPWPLGPTRLEKACLAYTGKVAQIHEIRRLIAPEQLLTVDYDTLIEAPDRCLRRIFEFAQANYDPAYARKIRPDSAKKAAALSRSARAQIDALTGEAYRECRLLAADFCAA